MQMIQSLKCIQISNSYPASVVRLNTRTKGYFKRNKQSKAQMTMVLPGAEPHCDVVTDGK